MRAILVIVLTLLALPAIAQLADPRQQGDELTSAFYAGEIDRVWERMTPQMQAALGSRENLEAFHAQIGQQLGEETAVVDRSVTSAQGHTVYLRRARFGKLPMVVLVQWAFDAEGKVAGFFIRPEQTAPREPAASEHLGYETRTRLRLPFDEAFFVFWGGRSIDENYHAVDANQRFALDLVVMRDGSSHDGEGRSNEDYYCFGTAILAPAAGTVVEVLDGVEDNVPGQTNKEVVTGNRLVIDHGNDEYSLLAHLRKGSVTVKEGDDVQAGQAIGQCGNSGNSSEPHLHYQLQDGPEFGTSAGLPAQFTGYLADGAPVARGEPSKGQTVRPAH